MRGGEGEIFHDFLLIKYVYLLSTIVVAHGPQFCPQNKVGTSPDLSGEMPTLPVNRSVTSSQLSNLSEPVLSSIVIITFTHSKELLKSTNERSM